MTIFIGFDCRCGSRTGGPSGARRRNAGAVRPSWPSTDCTALWSDTRSLCRKPSSNRPKRTNASPRGFSVNIASITAASGFTLHRQIPPALDTRRQPFFFCFSFYRCASRHVLGENQSAAITWAMHHLIITLRCNALFLVLLIDS